MTDNNDRRSFLAQLKERRVVRAAIAYAAAAFVVLQMADLLFPALGLSDTAYRRLVIGSLVGFPVALVLAWIFELTPQGIRLASAQGRVVLRFRRWMLFGAGGSLVALLVAGALLWLRPGLLVGEVARGADVIAVVPFTTSGAAVEGMGEGMVDLVSRNLDELGAIRTVDPRTVMHRWREHEAMDGVSGEEILAIGREVQAGSVLSGSVVAAGGRVRITADLLGLDGKRLATARVEGQEHEVLELVDSLSARLLQEIWRGRGPAPSLDIEAISTSNLTAIRSFLAGEQYYRASDWGRAVDAFERAVQADSGFALAYYRLARAAGWTSRIAHPREHYVELALAHADRLPRRARSLVFAEQLIVQGRRRDAVDTLRALVDRYPDDPELWQSLADAEYHLLDENALLAARPLPDRLRNFDRVLELDPGFAPALIHPLEIAFTHRDTALIERYVSMLSDIPSITPGPVRILEEGVAAIRDPNDQVQLITALSISLQMLARPREDLSWQMANAVLAGVMRAAATRSANQTAIVADWLQNQIQEKERAYGTRASVTLLNVLMSSGRLQRARRALTDENITADLSTGAISHYALVPVLAGYTTKLDSLIEQAIARDEAPLGMAVELIRAIDRRDPEGAAEVAAAATRSLAQDTGSAGAQRIEMLARGFADALRDGDGLDAIEATLREYHQPGSAIEALWFRWLELLTESEEARALEILREPWPGAPIYDVRRRRLLGRALAAQGHLAEARAAYEEFAAILSDADPGSQVREEMEVAQAKLDELAPPLDDGS